MNIRDLIEQLEQLEFDYGSETVVKLWLSIEGQLIDDFSLSFYDENEVHINSSSSKTD